TAPHDPSPYDATLFSRNTLSIAVTPLVEQGLLTEEELGAVVGLRPADALSRAAHADAHESARRLLAAAWLRARGDRAVQERVRRFTERNRAWLERAEIYAVLEALHGEPDWRRWPEPDRSLFSREFAGAHGQELRARGANEIAFYRFGQLLAHEQHEAFRTEAHQLGLLLFGDLQIGISHRDFWSHRALLLDTLRMGAPPSRTTPEGQPWGYGVLDPRLYGTRSAAGPAMAFVAGRVGKVLDEFIAEVLSTQPYPVRRVLERHGLGRFRVTQKSVLSDPRDVYRAENARPQDWIMVGTHDTESIWRVAERWAASGMSEQRAA